MTDPAKRLADACVKKEAMIEVFYSTQMALHSIEWPLDATPESKRLDAEYEAADEALSAAEKEYDEALKSYRAVKA